MNLCLVLNAAEEYLQIILAKNNEPICIEEWRSENRGTEILAPAIANICERLLVETSDISHIACVCGPGSFTGLRLVLSFAAAFKRANGAMLSGFNYMHVLAYNAKQNVICLENNMPDVFWVLTHAKRNLLHCQCFSAQMEPLTDIELLEPQIAAERIKNGFVLGSALVKWRELFVEKCPKAYILPNQYNNPTPLSLVALANSAEYGADDLQPLYIRPCDAIENLASISAKIGRNLEASQAELESLLKAEPIVFCV